MAGPGACYTDADLEGKKKDSIYNQVKDFLDKGETLAVATIVSTKGSTPREVGAKMVVTAWGEILGTIGGGCGEADVKREAIEVIRTRKPRTVRVDLLDDISSDSPAVCGGIMNVFIDPWWNESDQGAANSEGFRCPKNWFKSTSKARRRCSPPSSRLVPVFVLSRGRNVWSAMAKSVVKRSAIRASFRPSSRRALRVCALRNRSWFR